MNVITSAACNNLLIGIKFYRLNNRQPAMPCYLLPVEVRKVLCRAMAYHLVMRLHKHMAQLSNKAFWEIVDATIKTHYNHPEFESLQESELRTALSNLSDLDLRYFDYWSTIATYRMNRSALICAADVFFGEGEFSDDGLWYHCNWIASLGSEQWNLAISDPDGFYSRLANDVDYPLRFHYDAGSFAYRIVFEQFESRQMGDLKIDEMDKLIETERNKPREIGPESFPKLHAKLNEHSCDDFDPFDCDLAKRAQKHWEDQPNTNAR